MDVDVELNTTTGLKTVDVSEENLVLGCVTCCKSLVGFVARVS